MTESAPDFGHVCVLAILSLLVFWVGKQKKFFALPVTSWPVPVYLKHVIIAFLIYFGVSSLITPIIGKLLHNLFFNPPTPLSFLQYASWINVINSLLIFFLLTAFCFISPSALRNGIWKAPSHTHLDLSSALRTAAWGWLFSFPAVLLTNQFFDWAIFHLFQGAPLPEQLAVYFLKMTLAHPFYLFLAVFTIIIAAPVIEELLFRGFLQSWIRQHLGRGQAICVTSALFALFHYSPEQGIANVTIVASLFVFSLFIGFVYEKEGSLACPMMLHSLFNTINVCNLYFFGGIFDRSIQIHL